MKEFFSKFTQKGLPGGPNELKAFTEGFITSSEGQWAYPGMNTLIPNAGGRITMQGVNYPVLGIDDLGNQMMMEPGEEYQFPGDSVYEIPMKKGGLVKMPKLTKKNKKSYNKKFSSSIDATSRLFTESELFKKAKSKKKKVFDPNAKYKDGGEPGDKFKKRLMKRYPGMQGVYGPEGENLNIVKDPNYDARSVGYGDIEFIFPGDDPVLNYPNLIESGAPDYNYPNPSPDKYTALYNPKGANRGDIFLDMMHGMREDPNFQPLLQNFEKAVKNTRGEDMDWQYEGEVENGSTQSKERFDENYVDGQLRAQLAPGTIGMFSHGRKDYRMERKYDSPEMRQAAKDIKSYLKTPKEDYIEAELTPEEIEEYRKGGWVVEAIEEYDNGGGVNFQTYEEQLRQLENSIKAGYKGGRWYPHDSPEGGTKTIGYGHKMSGKENYSKGLTTAQVLAMQKKDLVKHKNIAKSMVDQKYGAGTFDRLPESRKVLLVDYAYNGVLHEFPNFMRATVKGDKAGMLKEYKRYTGSKPLTQRNEWTRSVIEGSNVGTAKTNTPKTLPAKTAPKKQPVKQPVKKPIAQPKFSSNETFSYDYRPDAVYRVADSGDWYINAGKDTHNEFIKLNDPTGKRTETLRKFAHINEVPLDQILNRINNSGNYDSRIDLGYVPGQ
jgi:GH24 family phage-related lysozyme (muramidase)